MLGIILIESYFLLGQPKQNIKNTPDTSDSTSSPIPSVQPNETSTELPNGTSNVVPNSFVPAVPEFTVELADHSYDVPSSTTTTIDPYTGKQNVTTKPGYHVENKTIEITIKNQPFISTNIDGNTTHLFYAIRWKGHFEDWPDKYYLSGIDYNYYLNNYGVPASNSDYTVKTYTLASFGNVPEEQGQVDFQVKAQVGYSFLYYGEHAHILPIGTDFQSVEESGWSNTRTITIP